MLQKARLFGIVIWVAGALCFLYAQQINISGIVSDAAGKGIAGAIVNLTAAQKTAITDAAGAYSITSGGTAVRLEQTPTSPWRSPFLNGTALSFTVVETAARVRLDLYTVLGTHVRTIFEKTMARGDYRINPVTEGLPSQIYFLKVRIGDNCVVLATPLVESAAHSEMAIKKTGSGAQPQLSKSEAVIDSFLVGAVGYTMLSQTTDTYSGIKNFTLQKTVPAGSVQVIQTTQAGEFLAAKAALVFASDDGSSLPTITVDSAVKYQTIVGFGGAFTEATAYNLDKIGPQKKNEILNAYFNPFTGSGYTLIRTQLQSCDFSVGKYSYDDSVNDFTLKYFSLQHETKWMMPGLKAAMSVPGSNFLLFASPWSPSAWMKSNNNMLNGGTLKSNCADAWALCFVKYIQGMKDNGIPIWGVTIQNEPEAIQSWESCIYTPATEHDFLKNNLGPALWQNNLKDIKVMIWDHNKDHIVTWADGIFGDTAAAKYAWGTAFHWYSGDQFENVLTTHNHFPAKHLIATEQADYLPMLNWGAANKFAHDIIGDLNNWAEGWTEWNLVLDQNGLPRHDPNTGCASSVYIDFTNNSVHYNPSYYYMAHFSKYIRPGAMRINCTNAVANLEATTFINNNGRIVIVALNRTANPISFKIKQGSQIIKPTIPAQAIMDFIF
jgi:glucosylceramidase